jgi:hypothetical protein
MHVCGDIIGLGLWESFQGLLMKHKAGLPISFGGTSLLSMEDYVPSIFLRSWALVALYLCSKFCIFDQPVLEEYFFKLKGALVMLMNDLR